MAEFWVWVVLAAVAFVASVMAGVTGFGSAVLLLPFLVEAVGPRDAVVVLTVAQAIGNLRRVGANRREVAWRVVAWYAVGAVPAAILGGALFGAVPGSGLTPLLGALLLLTVAAWFFRPVRFPHLPL